MEQQTNKRNLLFYKLALIIPITLFVNSMFVWLNYRQAEFWFQRRSDLSYESQFGSLINKASHYRAFSCGNKEATFLYYPYDPMISYLVLLPPTTRYYNMAPWVAEVGLEETITNLEGKYAIIYIDKGGYLWGYKTDDYLSELIDYLNVNYFEVEDKVYVSPLLQTFCSTSQESMQ